MVRRGRRARRGRPGGRAAVKVDAARRAVGAHLRHLAGRAVGRLAGRVGVRAEFRGRAAQPVIARAGRVARAGIRSVAVARRAVDQPAPRPELVGVKRLGLDARGRVRLDARGRMRLRVRVRVRLDARGRVRLGARGRVRLDVRGRVRRMRLLRRPFAAVLSIVGGVVLDGKVQLGIALIGILFHGTSELLTGRLERARRSGRGAAGTAEPVGAGFHRRIGTNPVDRAPSRCFSFRTLGRRPRERHLVMRAVRDAFGIATNPLQIGTTLKPVVRQDAQRRTRDARNMYN